MPTIDDFDIPAPLLAELRTTADRIKAGPLLTLAKAIPALATGVRPTAANARFIRQRLLPEHGRVREEVRELLAMEGLNGQLVMVLSLAALDECLAELLAIHGKEQLLAALLVDSRSEVRRLAIDYCRAPDWQSKPLPDYDTAITSLTDTLQPFLTTIGPLLSIPPVSTSSPVERAMASEDLTNCRHKVATLEESLRQTKEGNKTVKKLEAKVEELKRQLASIEEKADRERRLRLAAEKTAAAAQQRMETMRAEQDRAVEAAVEAEMQSVVRTWLVEPMRMSHAAAAAAYPEGSDILDRVRSALTHQAERDRHFGNRCQLRDRLLALRGAEDSLLRAANDSISPLPDLAGLIGELQEEAKRIEGVLAEDREESPVVHRFTAMIRQATDESGLTRIKRLLEDMELAGVLSPVESRGLYREYNACLGRLFDRFGHRPLAVSATTDPALIVGRGRVRDGNFRWLLDGYNILLGLGDLFEAAFAADGRPGPEARHRLLAAVDELLAGSAGLADVVFDGPTRSEENYSPQVKVIYSGGGGVSIRDRADQAIVYQLEVGRPDASTPAIVVTDDQALAGRCQALGAKVMPLQQFASILLSLPDFPES